MKKISIKRKRWLDRHSRYLSVSHNHFTSLPTIVTFQAPSIVDIARDAHRRNLIRFNTRLRLAFRAAKRGDVIQLSFRYTRKFIASGTLLLFSELSRLSELGHLKGVKFRCTSAENEKANQVLQKIGLFKLCSFRTKVVPSAEDVVSWNVAHGWTIEPELYAPAIEAREGSVAPRLMDGVWKGLAEATSNAVEHAYIDVRSDRLNLKAKKRDWWLFSQEKEGKIFVALCDLGIGIPRSLPLTKRGKGIWQRLLKIWNSQPKDSQAIREAIETSRTRTGLAERGKGLGEISDAVSALPDGEVWVYSNKGLYYKSESEERLHEYSDSILGTLVMWKFSVQDKI